MDFDCGVWMTLKAIERLPGFQIKSKSMFYAKINNHMSRSYAN